VAAPDSALAGPYLLSEVICVSQFARADSEFVELPKNAQRQESASAMREDIDANAEFPDVRGGFEDGAGNAQLMQGQCQSQSADAASRNQNAASESLKFAPMPRAAGGQLIISVHREFLSAQDGRGSVLAAAGMLR
jgi:hypothetical protein